MVRAPTRCWRPVSRQVCRGVRSSGCRVQGAGSRTGTAPVSPTSSNRHHRQGPPNPHQPLSARRCRVVGSQEPKVPLSLHASERQWMSIVLRQHLRSTIAYRKALPDQDQPAIQKNLSVRGVSTSNSQLWHQPLSDVVLLASPEYLELRSTMHAHGDAQEAGR
jgi:hypothetical protein